MAVVHHTHRGYCGFIGEDTVANHRKAPGSGFVRQRGSIVVAMTSAVSAATLRNGVCEVREFCMYHVPQPDRVAVGLQRIDPQLPGNSQPTRYDYKESA